MDLLVEFYESKNMHAFYCATRINKLRDSNSSVFDYLSFNDIIDSREFICKNYQIISLAHAIPAV